MEKRRQIILRSCIAAILVAVVATWLLFPGLQLVTVRRTTELVGPDEDAIALLYQAAPLAVIKSAVVGSGKDVDSIDWLGSSLLAEAVVANRQDVVTWLLEEGADPDGNSNWTTPLTRAVYGENVEMVGLLLRYGADPDYDRGRGDEVLTPRQQAAVVGNEEIIRLMDNSD